jgi:hypothetical protein
VLCGIGSSLSTTDSDSDKGRPPSSRRTSEDFLRSAFRRLRLSGLFLILALSFYSFIMRLGHVDRISRICHVVHHLTPSVSSSPAWTWHSPMQAWNLSCSCSGPRLVRGDLAGERPCPGCAQWRYGDQLGGQEANKIRQTFSVCLCGMRHRRTKWCSHYSSRILVWRRRIWFCELCS